MLVVGPWHLFPLAPFPLGVLNHLIFHPTEPWLIAGGGGDSGGILALWDLRKTAPAQKGKPKGHLQQLALSTDRSQILAVGYGGGFQIWQVEQVG